jgi:hypothetical protein
MSRDFAVPARIVAAFVARPHGGAHRARVAALPAVPRLRGAVVAGPDDGLPRLCEQWSPDV